MKSVRLYVFMVSIVFFFGCKKEYNDIGSKEKDIFLFYSYDVGNSFRMVRHADNATDTLTFTVVQKDIQYVKRYHSLNKFDQYYILAFTCEKNDNLQLYHSGGVYLTLDDTALFLNELFVKELIAENDSITVNGKYYDNLYKLSDDNRVTFALLSGQYGIVKMWTEGITYELLP